MLIKKQKSIFDSNLKFLIDFQIYIIPNYFILLFPKFKLLTYIDNKNYLFFKAYANKSDPYSFKLLLSI